MAFGLVVALGLAEVALRIFGHEGPVYTIRDPVIGRRYTRSWEGDCTIEEADRVVHLRFNREGMRDRDYPEAAPEGTVRIAVLGDSMVAALGVDEDKTFGRLLESHLQAAEDALAKGEARSPRRFEVMNWGVQGSSPALESVLYEERIRRYAPSLALLVFFSGNDFSDDWQPIGGRRQGWGEVRPDGSLEHEPFGGSDFSFTEWLARNSRFYVWQKRMLSRLHGDDEPGLRPGLRIFDRSADPELARAWAFQEQVHARLVSRMRDGGTDVVSLYLPCAEEVYDDLWGATLERARPLGWDLDRNLPRSRLTGGPDFDLRSGNPVMGPGSAPQMRGYLVDAMQKVAAGRPSTDLRTQLFLRGTGHLNERGHALVARTLLERQSVVLLGAR